jgi:uncharacterized membrane protein
MANPICEQNPKGEEYYALFYIQNVQLIWRTRDWPVVIIFFIIALLLIKMSFLAIVLTLIPILTGIALGPYTAESLYKNMKKFSALYAEAGKRYTDMFERLRWMRFRSFEPQLFWKGRLWSLFSFRFFLLTSVSLTCWYYLAFNLHGFKYYFHAAAWLLFIYLSFGCHWLVARWWWKHKVVNEDKYKDLCRF